MADIEKIIENLNLPKQILDKSEALFKTLFGPSFNELGGMISDSIRLRRFKNQIKIFSKAQNILRDKNIDPKKVSLKVLAPLIEYSSYEEEETLQDKWASLTAHILSTDSETIFKQNCISVLNKISTEDAMLIDQLHELLTEKRLARYKKQVDTFQRQMKFIDDPPKPKEPEEIPLERLIFGIRKTAKELDMPQNSLSINISNLVTLGLLKWETDVEVSAEKSSEDPEDTDIDVSVDVYNNDDFIFTHFGDRFVRSCKTK